jgi:hypothetical protein
MSIHVRRYSRFAFVLFYESFLLSNNTRTQDQWIAAQLLMHNESVLTLFDPMTHTPLAGRRYVIFSTDCWLLVCLSRTPCIVNLDLVTMGWKDSRIS